MKKKNNLEIFLASSAGARFFNFFYSWGASVVIIGAMFKIVHLPYADAILMVGMITEALVFFVWGFASPETTENLKKDHEEKTQEAIGNGISGSVVVGGGNIQSHGNGTISGIKPAKNAGDNIAVSGGNMEFITNEMNGVNNVSSSLLESYQKILNNTEGLSVSSEVFAKNIEVLNQHVAGLNNIYESQLQSISDQMAAVKHTNESLDRIKNMYSEAVFDSSAFKRETEKMTKNIEALNSVYSRLLDAMTTSSHMRP